MGVVTVHVDCSTCIVRGSSARSEELLAGLVNNVSSESNDGGAPVHVVSRRILRLNSSSSEKEWISTDGTHLIVAVPRVEGSRGIWTLYLAPLTYSHSTKDIRGWYTALVRQD
jgi:hypothetical protein